MERLAAALLLVAAAACGSSPPVADPRAASPEPSPTGNFFLAVSNQSFDRPTVDITVLIDGRKVADQDFAVEGQHNWVEFVLDVPAGEHELRAVSKDGNAEFRRTITSFPRTWVVLNYWCCGQPDDPKFTFDVSDEPVAFA